MFENTHLNESPLINESPCFSLWIPPAVVFTSSYEQRCNEVFVQTALEAMTLQLHNERCIFSLNYYTSHVHLGKDMYNGCKDNVFQDAGGFCSRWLLLLKLQLCVFIENIWKTACFLLIWNKTLTYYEDQTCEVRDIWIVQVKSVLPIPMVPMVPMIYFMRCVILTWLILTWNHD